MRIGLLYAVEIAVQLAACDANTPENRDDQQGGAASAPEAGTQRGFAVLGVPGQSRLSNDGGVLVGQCFSRNADEFGLVIGDRHDDHIAEQDERQAVLVGYMNVVLNL